MRVMSLTSQPSQPFSAFWTLLIPLPLIYVTLLKIVFKKCVSTWALKTRKIRLFGTSLNKIFYCREQIQVANKPVFPSPYATPSTPPTRPNADECDGTHAQKMIEFWCRKWRAFWAFIHPPFLVSQSLTLIFYVFNFNHYNTIWPKIHKAINQT